ncbi:TraB/GumN family protein [Ascidiimonas sp. W6]|uniref:TraB/GumN family protein n=1 Tax=Ascidiimonas meishanensis TaxID=3128903 RepID=UPI0030ED2CCB
MNYLKSILTLVFIISFSTINAQKNEPLENSVLWKIEHTDLEKTSYLLGTLHLMCSEDFKLADKIVNTLKNADVLVSEINMSNPEEIKAMQDYMANPKKVSEELTEEQFNKLDALTQNVINMPLSNLDNYGLSGLYSIMFSKMLPCSDLKFMDVELQKLAIENGLSISAFEKATEQLDYLKKGFSVDFTFNQLMLFESYKTDFNKAIKLYLEEDIETAVGLITKEQYMDENAKKYIQIIRNKNWVKKIPQMMAESSNVFAVGAAHLTGEEGIINLLRNKGYTITAVLK